MSKPRFEFATFTASEAERISGVNGENQRNLRRHKYMPAIGGTRARLSLEEVACLVVIGILSRFPPAITTKIALKCAPMIVANALLLDGTIEGGDKYALNQLLKKFAPKGVDRYAIAFAPDFTELRFIKGTRQEVAKIYSARSEYPIFVHDLEFYARMMRDNANRPLVKVIAEEEAA